MNKCTTKEKLIIWTTVSVFTLGIALGLGFGLKSSDKVPDSKFSFIGKVKKTNASYENPPFVKIAWKNFLELAEEFDRPWSWCAGGKSSMFGDEFNFTMEMTQDMFDKNITTDPFVLPWWSEFFSVPKDEISKIKFAMGFIKGYYHDDEFECVIDFPTPGPIGEVAMVDRYAVFYRNGTWPGPGPGDICSFMDWAFNIPQGFSCGVATRPTPPPYCDSDEFVPVDCSEVVLKVAAPRYCGMWWDDCFWFSDWFLDFF